MGDHVVTTGSVNKLRLVSQTKQSLVYNKLRNDKPGQYLVEWYLVILIMKL